MKLSKLVLEGDKKIEKLNKANPINFQSYHVTEIFMNFLPKIDLDGNDKLVIYFKEKPEFEERYVCDKDFHVSWYYVDRSDIDKLKKLDKNTLNEYYLNIIARTLKDIGQQNNCGEEVFTIIEETVQKVIKSNFELTQKINRLSKVSQDKQFKSKVYRHIDNQGEIWYVELEDNNKNIYKYDIMKKPSHISKLDFYKKSQWKNGEFILLNKLDQVVATIQVD